MASIRIDGSVAGRVLQLIVVIRGLDPGIHRTFEARSENDESPDGIAVRRFFGRNRIAQGWNRRRFDRPSWPGVIAVGSLVGPGEGDLVERLGAELFRRARHHAAAEGAVELRRRIVVGQRPDHHALEDALQQVAAGRGKGAAAEAEALEFRAQIKLVDLALEMKAAGAVAAVIGIARDFVTEYQHANAAAFADRAIPPLRSAAV